MEKKEFIEKILKEARETFREEQRCRDAEKSIEILTQGLDVIIQLAEDELFRDS